MKLEIKTSFDFGKVSKSMPNMIGKYIANYATGVEKGTKRNIDRSVSNTGTSLQSYTAKKEGRKPLINSGEMYHSIKSQQGKLSILEYGYKHHAGLWNHLRKETNVLNFIGTTRANKQEADKQFLKNIRIALKK
tara:strand:- start:40 stop:441 length:402 start_codon:yes stop_codon:yes gene_type:complete